MSAASADEIRSGLFPEESRRVVCAELPPTGTPAKKPRSVDVVITGLSVSPLTRAATNCGLGSQPAAGMAITPRGLGRAGQFRLDHAQLGQQLVGRQGWVAARPR